MKILVTDATMATTRNGPEWTITALRPVLPVVHGVTPTAADLPPDIRAGLRAWLETDPE